MTTARYIALVTAMCVVIFAFIVVILPMAIDKELNRQLLNCERLERLGYAVECQPPETGVNDGQED